MCIVWLYLSLYRCLYQEQTPLYTLSGLVLSWSLWWLSRMPSLWLDFIWSVKCVCLSIWGTIIESLLGSTTCILFGHNGLFFNRLVCFMSSRSFLMLLVCAYPFALVLIGLLIHIFGFYLYFDFLGQFNETMGEVRLKTHIQATI